MDTINIEGLKRVFDHLQEIMEENRDHLTELDGVMGDGDLGLTMRKAFNAAHEEAQGFEGKDVGQLFVKVGMKIAQSAPSTMGTLLATGFMKGGKAILSKEVLTLSDLALFFRSFTDGIMVAGKTKPGNKTFVDPLNDLSISLEEAAKNKSTLAEGVNAAYKAAQEGAEHTKEMKAQHGRAAYYQDKSIGIKDAGAEVAPLIMKGFYSYVKD